MSWASRVYGQVSRGTYRQLRISFLGNTDAPQMTKSIRPNFAMVSSTAFFNAAGWRTSAAAAKHFPPVAFSSFDALSASPFALQSDSSRCALRVKMDRRTAFANRPSGTHLHVVTYSRPTMAALTPCRIIVSVIL